MIRTLVIVVYLLVGVYVASTHHYLGDLNSLKEIVSAALAILLWPLVLIGVDLHLGTGGGNGDHKKKGALAFLYLLRPNSRRI